MTAAAAAKGKWGRRLLQALVMLVALGGLVAITLWATAALYFDVRIAWLRGPLAGAYLGVIVTLWVVIKPRWRAALLTSTAFILVLGWWLLLKPSNDRNWIPDLAVLPYAEFSGDRVTIHNIRNCDYRSETDFDVRHYDRTFNLSDLKTVDLYMVYWGSPLMAHTMVSFGFGDDQYVCFSIETRKEQGEGYSAVKGLFRQFELTYVIADERDVVRLRTNYRQGEDAYLYRLKVTPEAARQFFLEYIHRANSLRIQPEWYNAVTDNCTTGIRTQRAAADRAPWNWRILVNGLGNELLYTRGRIATNLPLPQVKELGHINARARAADQNENFSKLIREGLPDPNSAPAK
ncbi:MAG: DUF4105 domain-containing protein [Verrucomicrobiota bacterium]